VKTYYNQEVSKWLMADPGRIVTKYHISSLSSTAYRKAETIANAQSGFRKTGIWPLSTDIHMYIKTSLLHRPHISLSQTQMKTSTPV
jgi:hypothetical protein